MRLIQCIKNPSLFDVDEKHNVYITNHNKKN